MRGACRAAMPQVSCRGGQHVDDTLGVFHTHAVAGLLGGVCVGLFAEPQLCTYMGLAVTNSNGLFYGGTGGMQVLKQLVGAAFIIGWNIVVTTLIMVFINFVMPLRMSEEHLLVGDDAEHGEEAYALWADGERFDSRQTAVDLDNMDSMDGNAGLHPAGRNGILHI